MFFRVERHQVISESGEHVDDWMWTEVPDMVDSHQLQLQFEQPNTTCAVILVWSADKRVDTRQRWNVCALSTVKVRNSRHQLRGYSS